MVEMVVTYGLGPYAFGCESSSLSWGTIGIVEQLVARRSVKPLSNDVVSSSLTYPT